MKKILTLTITLLILTITSNIFASQKAYIILHKDGTTSKHSTLNAQIDEYIEKDTCQYIWDDSIKKCVHCEYGTYNTDQHRCEFVKYKYFSTGNLSWWTAKNNCANQGNHWHLVTITSSDENSKLRAFISWNTWIGLTDYQQEGHFKWITGEPVIFTDWHSGEPNNYGGNEDYACLYGYGGWNDEGNNPVSRYICEHEWDPDFVTNLPPICPNGYSYVKEGNKGLCVKQF